MTDNINHTKISLADCLVLEPDTAAALLKD